LRPDVTIVAPYPPRGSRHAGTTGVASYVANLAHALADRGASVSVIAQAEAGEPRELRDGAIRVQRSWGRGAGALPTAARAAAATGAPVVHLQHETFLYGGALAAPGIGPALSSLRRRAGLAVTMHHVVDPRRVDQGFVALHGVRAPATMARAGLAAVQGAIAARADRVIVHEPAFARVIPGAAVVPHGIEPAAPWPRADARRLLGLDDRLAVLCFGHVAPYKGLEAALMAATGADGVQLVVAGGAHPRMETYAQRLAERFAPVARFTGYVPEADVAAWFSAADVALFNYPAAFSSSGALALALAYRTPALLSPALTAAYGAPATLAVPRAPEGLARRLGALAADTGALARLGEQTQVLARDRAWSTIAGRHLDLYEEVKRVDRRSGRRLRAA
jgi:glycosyltransferase involved in cell wall biosynthesis